MNNCVIELTEYDNCYKIYGFCEEISNIIDWCKISIGEKNFIFWFWNLDSKQLCLIDFNAPEYKLMFDLRWIN